MEADSFKPLQLIEINGQQERLTDDSETWVACNVLQ